jgi:hypothetical protein
LASFVTSRSAQARWGSARTLCQLPTVRKRRGNPVTSKAWIMPSGPADLEVVVTISNSGPMGVEISKIGAAVPIYFVPVGHMSRFKVRVGQSISWKRDGAFKPFVLGSNRSMKVLHSKDLFDLPQRRSTYSVPHNGRIRWCRNEHGKGASLITGPGWSTNP